MRITGSWEGVIRVWQLDPKLKSFALVGTIPAPGVVNSLQFVTPPKEFIRRANWASSQDGDGGEETVNGAGSILSSVLLTAGMGQEPKFGRWLTVKEGGASNGALVFALTPRTSSLARS